MKAYLQDKRTPRTKILLNPLQEIFQYLEKKNILQHNRER